MEKFLELNVEKKEGVKLIDRKRLSNTPFDLVKLDNNDNSFIALGYNMITDPLFTSEKEANDYLKKNMWDIVIKISFLAVQLINKDNG